MNFKVRLRETRLAAGLSQERLAHICGLSFQSVNLYEGGKQAPSGENVAKLARALGCTTDYLLGMDEEAAS